MNRNKNIKHLLPRLLTGSLKRNISRRMRIDLCRSIHYILSIAAILIPLPISFTVQLSNGCNRYDELLKRKRFPAGRIHKIYTNRQLALLGKNNLDRFAVSGNVPFHT
jgi:hypothetical protein